MASDRCTARGWDHSMRWMRSSRVLRWDVVLIPSPAAVGAARKHNAMPSPASATGLRGSRGASRGGLAGAGRSSSERGRPASRVRPSGSWGACREERQVDRVMNVVHAIRGTFGQARADRSDDDEAVLVSEIRIEEDRGSYSTTGGLLAVGV